MTERGTTALKRSIQLAILVLLAVGLKTGWDYVHNGGISPISVIKVEANYGHLSPEILQKSISRDLPASFWTVDVRALKARLEAMAWVQSVDIEKVWPETLKIRISEKQVLARWGEKGLLTNKEAIFYPETAVLSEYETMPVLYGPENQIKTVIQQYQIMTQMLKKKQLAIGMLLMNESGAWFVRLTDGTLLLIGREDPLKRLARFLRSYDAVFITEQSVEQPKVARRVDLRYPHGMAISWGNVMNPVTDQE